MKKVIQDGIAEMDGLYFRAEWLDTAHGGKWRKIGEIWGEDDQLEEVIERDCYAFRDAMRMARGRAVHVLDAGACLGVFSLHAFRLGAAHVLAFEPNPIARRTFLLNCLLNDALSCVELRPEAIGPAEPRRRGLLLTDGQFGGTGFTENIEAGEPVSVWTLGEAATRMWPRWDPHLAVYPRARALTFLKMDVEFGEHAIFLDYTKGLRREDAWFWLHRFDFISIEWHGPRSDVLLDLCVETQHRLARGLEPEHTLVKHTKLRDDLNIICLAKSELKEEP